MRIVFATNNKHKILEVVDMLPDNIQILSLEDIGCYKEIPETSDTIEGNSHQKARFIYDLYGYNCFADDTGLEVHSLNGEPGVSSARYAGIDSIAENNIIKLLNNLEGKKNREAIFRTVITLILNGESICFEGSIKGTIVKQKIGDKGFGYDPIFRPEGYKNTFAQMSQKEKGTISHRGIATKKLINYLKEY